VTEQVEPEVGERPVGKRLAKSPTSYEAARSLSLSGPDRATAAVALMAESSYQQGLASQAVVNRGD
jgi:hypothetical protein